MMAVEGAIGRVAIQNITRVDISIGRHLAKHIYTIVVVIIPNLIINRSVKSIRTVNVVTIDADNSRP
jgi:hypothetical protein